jgi:hypothetical protein
MFKIIFTLFIIFKFTATFASNFIEEIEGCPENSYCTKEVGKLRLGFINALKKLRENPNIINEFINKNGILFPVWPKKYDEKKMMIAWDAPCKSKTESKQLIGEYFLKKLNLESENNNNFDFHYSFLILNENGNYNIYPIPRGDTPLKMTKDGLYFLRSEDSIFYGLNILRTGKIKIVNALKVKELPQNTECPKELEVAFLRHASLRPYYKDVFCKKILDDRTGKMTTIALGRTCN